MACSVRAGKAEGLEGSGPVSKGQLSGERERMKVWEREHLTQGGHREDPTRQVEGEP